MDISKIKDGLGLVRGLAVKKSPEILTGIGICGFVTTVAMTAKMAPKIDARHYKYDLLRENAARNGDVEAVKELKIEEAKELAGPCLAIAASGGLSIGCIIGAQHIQSKRLATVVTAYSLAEKTLDTYQKKLEERFGEEAREGLMQAVSDKLAEDELPFDESYSYLPGEDGKSLCYDRVTGRYFRADVSDIRNAESEVNKRLIDETIVRLGEFYYALGLDDSGFICDGLGWDISKGSMSVYFTSMLDKDDNPCLVLNYNVDIVDRSILDGR